MSRVKKTFYAGTPPPSGLGPITAENYIERAIAHMRQSGRANGDHPVIRSAEGAKPGKPETPEQWRAWMLYFDRLGIKTNAARYLGVMTVPTMWPWEFDRSAPEEIPDVPPPKRQQTQSRILPPKYRLRPMADPLTKPDRPKHPFLAARENPPTPIDHSKPVKLSGSARAACGLMQEQSDD